MPQSAGLTNCAPYPMPLAIDPAKLPKPYDLRQAQIELERLAALWCQTDETGLPGAAERQALLTAVFGNSPYVSHLIVSEAAHFYSVLADGPDSVFNKLLNDLAGLALAETDEVSLMRELRVAKKRAHLTIAIADIVGAWPLERVTAALSDFADSAVAAATAYLLRQAHGGGELDLPHPENPVLESGLVILGLGKLGARELNYSSDIDLIVLFDLERVHYRGKRTARECFVKLARGLVKLLQDATQDGYVLRVDLRLRPDPSSTPLAMSTIAAETYYESLGQNWERAAMIKARPVAGCPDLGARFIALADRAAYGGVPERSAVDEVREMRQVLQGSRAQVASCRTWNSLEHVVLKTERALLQEVIEWHSIRSFSSSH